MCAEHNAGEDEGVAVDGGRGEGVDPAEVSGDDVDFVRGDAPNFAGDGVTVLRQAGKGGHASGQR